LPPQVNGAAWETVARSQDYYGPVERRLSIHELTLRLVRRDRIYVFLFMATVCFDAPTTS
jgi:hypothetical protein